MVEEAKQDSMTQVKKAEDGANKDGANKPESALNKKDKEEQATWQEQAETQKSQKEHSDKEKIAELTDSLKRLQAEFENFKKRRDKEEEEKRQYINAGLIEKMLPVIDAFELAIKQKNSKEFAKGIEMIYLKLISILEKEGLRPINVLNKPFDPYKCEVLMQQEVGEEKEGIVIEEFQKGYMLKDRVLRHAKVKVGIVKSRINKDSGGKK